MAKAAEATKRPVPEPTPPTSSGTPQPISTPVASAGAVVPATAARPARDRIFAIPPWRGAARGSSATPAATRTRVTVVSRPDTATPPLTTTASSEAARPSPISTTDARPMPEPRAIEARTTRVRNYVIPPRTGASSDGSSATAAATATTAAPAAPAAPAAAEVVNAPGAATPPPTTAAVETTRPSPMSTTAALPTSEEVNALEAIMSWVRTFVIHPRAGESRDNTSTAAATTIPTNCPDTVTPPPTTTASEAARPSPISTTDAPTTVEEPSAIEALAARVRTSVIPPWTGVSRDNSTTAAPATPPTATAAIATAASSPDTATPLPTTTASEAARPSPISTTDARPLPHKEPRAIEARTTRVRNYVIPPWTGASRDNSTTAAPATPSTATAAASTASTSAVVTRPDTATPPPTYAASEAAARLSPISTTDARPTPEEEPRATEQSPGTARTYVVPQWAEVLLGNIAIAAAAAASSRAADRELSTSTSTSAVVTCPDTANPPPTYAASEAARPSPIPTTDARPTLEEEPRPMEPRPARARTYVTPPWAPALRDNIAVAAATAPARAADRELLKSTSTSAVVTCPDTVTPPPTCTASEAARLSPTSTTGARPTLEEEPRLIEPRPARARTYVTPPWAPTLRDNIATAAATAPARAADRELLKSTSTSAVVTCPDTATPPPTCTASEAARPSPTSTTGARPTLEEEPRPIEPRPARARTYVTPPWAGALRDNTDIAAATASARAAERELTRAEAQAIVDAADMAAAEEVVAANEAADALAIAQAVVQSGPAGTPADSEGRREGGGGDGGRISLALHHRVRQARERASSTCSDQVRGRVRNEDMRMDPGSQTDGVVDRGRFSRVRPGRVRIASSSSDQATERSSDAETELSSGTLTDLDEGRILLVQQGRVTLPRERAARLSREEAALRASDVAEMDVGSESQTEGEEGDGGCVSVAQERGRLPRGRAADRSRSHAREDVSSTVAAVATESTSQRRTQSCPPACERPPPPTAVAEPDDAVSRSEVGEQTAPTTQAAATQTDTEGEPSDSSEAEVADVQTETEEEALETPPPEVAEVHTEVEAEAEAEDVALGGSSGTVFPIVREDPDTGAAAFRSGSCAECQSLIVDASAHRDTFGMKGKVSAGLNADRCRNCWRVVCDSCIGTCWARTMVPKMYTRDSDSHRMRVCKTCHCAMEMFRKSLLLGRVEESMAAYGTGCVNLDTPYTTYHGEVLIGSRVSGACPATTDQIVALPVHCAAAGGNVVLLSWLVDELGCSLFVDDDLKKPLRDLRSLTVLGAAAVNAQVQTMRYLVNTKRCSLFEITHLPTMKKALEACLHVSPETMFTLGAPGSSPPRQQFTEITTDISLRADGERSSYVDRGGPIQVSAAFGSVSAFDDEDDCCIVCFDNEVACTLVPCGHHCCCRDCAARLSHCPVCRARITEIIKAIPV